MKRIVLTIVLLAVISSPDILAQEPDHPPHEIKKKEGEKKDPSEIAEERTKHLTEELDLTEEQADQVRELHEDHAKKMQKLHEDKKALRDQFLEARDEMKSGMDLVLNEDQKKKMKKMHEERKQKRKDHLPQCCKHCHKPE